MAVRRKRTAKESSTIMDGEDSEERLLMMTEKEELLKNIFVPFEAKIMSLQGLLVWETPQYSFVLFAVVNLIFWLATYMRIYYLTGMVGFCVCSWELWAHHIWPEIRVPPPAGQDTEDWTPVHPRLLSVPEICSHVARVMVRGELFVRSAYTMRKEHPAKFFVYAMTLFALLGGFGHYVRGFYVVYCTVMGILLLPSVYYYDVIDKIQAKLHPIVEQAETSMNIKRKRSKKGKKGRDGSRVAEFSDSEDEEIQSFVPHVPESQISQLSLKPQNTEFDDSLRLTPQPTHMPEVTPSRDVSDDDSTLGDLPSQMPSIMNMDDSLTYDFRLSDTMDGNASNNNQHEAVLPEEDDTEADVTIHDDDSLALSSLHTDSTARAPQVTGSADTSHAAAVKPVKEAQDMKESQSTKSLKFVAGHFKENSSDDDDESRLGHGLEFPDFDKEQETSEDGNSAASGGALGLISNLAQGSGQQMGAILAGALSGAQDTVSNVVASQMMSSIMQKAGFQKPPSGIDPKTKVKLEGQGSRDSDTEFEFLSQEDLENLDDQQG